jgi:hypothetical protein
MLRFPLKIAAFLVEFDEHNFLDRNSQNNQISNFVKIRKVGTELLPADGQTDGPIERYEKATFPFSLYYESA